MCAQCGHTEPHAQEGPVLGVQCFALAILKFLIIDSEFVFCKQSPLEGLGALAHINFQVLSPSHRTPSPLFPPIGGLGISGGVCSDVCTPHASVGRTAGAIGSALTPQVSIPVTEGV